MQSERKGLITVTAYLTAGDAGPIPVIAAVANKIPKLVTCLFDHSVAAAQSIAIEATSGEDVIRIAGSATPVQHGFQNLIEGYPLPVGTGLQISVSGVGNAGVLIVQYYVDNNYVQ